MAPIIPPEVIPIPVVVKRRAVVNHENGWHIGLLTAGFLIALFHYRPGTLAKLGLPDWLFVIFGCFLILGSTLVLVSSVWDWLKVRRTQQSSYGALSIEAAGLSLTAAAESVYAYALHYSFTTSFLAVLGIVGLVLFGNLGRIWVIWREMVQAASIGKARQEASARNAVRGL